MSLQMDVDYMNEAQYRVAADTGLLEEKTTLTITTSPFTLPERVSAIHAVYQGNTELVEVLSDQMLCHLSAVNEVNISSRFGYCLIGRSLYLTPTPTVPVEVTLVHTARPDPYQSNQDLEVQGEGKILVERLVAAMKLQDDGQPERAASELYGYSKDARRQQGQTSAQGGTPRRMLTPAYDRVL